MGLPSHACGGVLVQSHYAEALAVHLLAVRCLLNAGADSVSCLGLCADSV